MKRSKSLEDYLECIYILSQQVDDVHQIDVARKLCVSQPAVLKAMNGLKADGYLDYDGLHIRLTEQGLDFAMQVYDKHVTLRNFLQSLGISETTADADACEIEHVISEETFDKIKDFVNNK